MRSRLEDLENRLYRENRVLDYLKRFIQTIRNEDKVILFGAGMGGGEHVFIFRRV